MALPAGKLTLSLLLSGWLAFSPCGADPRPPTLRAVIHVAGVSAAAVLTGDRLLLAPEEGSRLALFTAPAVRLLSQRLEPGTAELLSPPFKEPMALDDV